MEDRFSILEIWEVELGVRKMGSSFFEVEFARFVLFQFDCFHDYFGCVDR